MSDHDDMRQAAHRIATEIKADGGRGLLSELDVLMEQLDEYKTSHVQQLAYQQRLNVRIAELESEVDELSSALTERGERD